MFLHCKRQNEENIVPYYEILASSTIVVKDVTGPLNPLTCITWYYVIWILKEH